MFVDNRTRAPRFTLSASDDTYPRQLLPYQDEFEIIYGIGDQRALQTCVAIIGSRKATPYGLSVARLIAGWCAEEGISVVSGGARGCDQAAHRGALERGGKTVAVLGCGADVTYPANAQRLLSDISEHGAIVSEYEWSTPAAKFRFVQRNRLIAALSSVVIVVEGALPSGTFSTVNHATELGVSVAGVPGSLYSPLSGAPNRLIRDGAYCICSKEDLMTACSLEGAKPTPPSEEIAESDMLRALSAMPLTPEEVAQYCKMNVQDALYELNKLEALGKITRVQGGAFALLEIRN